MVRIEEMKRILLLSVTAGAGHLRAAQALEEVIRREYPSLSLEHVDALEYTNKAFRRGFTSGYEKLARELPAVWGMIYEALEEKPPDSKTKALAKLFDNLNAAPLWKMVREYDPHAVICTHYMPAEVLGSRRIKGELAAPLYVTLTDFCIHAMWIQDGIDHYFVAAEEMAYALRMKGIGKGAVTVSGIPISPVFSAGYPAKAEMRKTLGLRTDPPTVLLSAGGFGLGEIDDTVGVLSETFDEVQFLAVAGRNEELRKALAGAAERHPGKIVPFGFVDNMHELMAASDLAVTKCGGLTSSECLAMGLPMVIIKPIPGQEERNADYLLESGAAVRSHSNAHTVFKVETLLKDPDRIQAMSAAARRIARPRAARDVVARVVGDLSG